MLARSTLFQHDRPRGQHTYRAGLAGMRRTMAIQSYRGPQVCKIVGISYRQLDYWTRTGLITPSIKAASGSGIQREYSYQDLVALKTIKSLLDTGISLQKVRE